MHKHGPDAPGRAGIAVVDAAAVVVVTTAAIVVAVAVDEAPVVDDAAADVAFSKGEELVVDGVHAASLVVDEGVPVVDSGDAAVVVDGTAVDDDDACLATDVDAFNKGEALVVDGTRLVVVAASEVALVVAGVALVVVVDIASPAVADVELLPAAAVVVDVALLPAATATDTAAERQQIASRRLVRRMPYSYPARRAWLFLSSQSLSCESAPNRIYCHTCLNIAQWL